MNIKLLNDWKEDYFSFIQVTIGNCIGTDAWFTVIFFGLGFTINWKQQGGGQ
jgi:hypothetical protein